MQRGDEDLFARIAKIVTIVRGFPRASSTFYAMVSVWLQPRATHAKTLKSLRV